MLLRIKLAPRNYDDFRVLSINDYPQDQWEKLQLWIPAPQYSKGKYNTAEMQVNESEKELFEVLKTRKRETTLDKAIELALKDERFETLMQNQPNNEQVILELSNILEDILVINSNIRFIDLKYYAIYNPKSGFKFAIDGFHNLPKESIFVCIFCLNPPGTLYSDKVDKLKINFNSAFDWSSPVTSPKYIEGYIGFKDVPFNRSTCFILDIREIKIKKKKIEIKEYAWTILPLYTYDGYVNSGVYQIPLFKGAVKKIVLKEIGISKEPWKKMLDFVKRKDEYNNKKILEYLEPASIVVRLLDGQREGHLKTSFDYKRMDYSYIPKNKYYAYSYNEAVANRLKKHKKMDTLKPSTTSELELNNRITDAIIEAFNLDHYKNMHRL